jgi:uncharacterized membrane protein
MTIYYIAVALIQIALAVIMFRLWRKSDSIYPIFPLIVILGIIYDNSIIGFGSFVGEGELLKGLNAPRFVIHALFTPCIMIFAFGVARRVGIGWAQSKIAHTLICVFTTLMIALGVYHEIIQLALVPKAEGGTLRYVNSAAKGAPIPAIATIIVVMIIAVFVWIKTKKPWYFLGTLLMFLLAPLAPKFLWAGNLGEIFMNLGGIFGEKAAQAGKHNG